MGHPIARFFVLAGQSNVLGFASLDHLLQLDAVQDNNNRLLRYRYTEPGTAATANPDWIVRDDVFVTFDREYGDRRPTRLEGMLQANLYGADNAKFGPEVGFGNLMGDYFGGQDSTASDPVVILKAGGVAPLATDWNADGGDFYQLLLADIEDSLGRVAQITDNAATEGELCGVVWFHGYADVFEPDFLAEYETNLRGLVDSLREDLDMPDLPIVIGEMGGGGSSPGEEEQQMRQIQSTVASEYDGVTLAQTANLNTGFDVNDPDEVFDEDFHYYGRAEVIEKVGMEFASSMVGLLDAEKLQLEEESEAPSLVPTLAPTTPETSTLPSSSPSETPNDFFPEDPEPTASPTTNSPVDGNTPTESPDASSTPPPTTTNSSPPPTSTDGGPPDDDQEGAVYPFYGPEAFLNGRPMNNPNPYGYLQSSSRNPIHSSSKCWKRKGKSRLIIQAIKGWRQR